jgi:DUF971 family protein
LSEYRPQGIRRCDNGSIAIDWNDGLKSEYSAQNLRDACPCATCREKRTIPRERNPLQVLESSDLVSLSIREMQPIGQYAYKILFSDGHDSGIYTLEYLRELG